MQKWDEALRLAALEYESGEAARNTIRRVIERIMVEKIERTWKITFVRFGAGSISEIFDPTDYDPETDLEWGETRYEIEDITEFWNIVRRIRSE